MFQMHVNYAFDSGDVEAQKKVCKFATKMTTPEDRKNDKKGGKGDKKPKKQKGAETREQALAML